jgi:sodium transport system ATP-binding protein
MAQVNLRKLVKHYDETPAVRGIDLDISDKEFVVLVGPSGCGKTTTLRMIAGLLRPMGGTVTIDDRDVTRTPREARGILGVQSDMTGVYPRLTAREQIRYYGRFYGLKGAELEARVQAVIDELNMQEIAERRAEGFSRGERQKIVLARALVHDPRNIIMDEPTNGLDVMAVRETRETIRKLKGQGRCVLFSTHYMDEAERLCDTIAIIVRGQIVAGGTPAELMARTGKDNLEDAFVTLAGGAEGLLRSEFANHLQEA